MPARCTHWCPTVYSGLFQSCTEFHRIDILPQPNVHHGHFSRLQHRGLWIMLLWIPLGELESVFQGTYGEGITDHTSEEGDHQFPKEAVTPAHPPVPCEGSGFTGSCQHLELSIFPFEPSWWDQVSLMHDSTRLWVPTMKGPSPACVSPGLCTWLLLNGKSSSWVPYTNPH